MMTEIERKEAIKKLEKVMDDSLKMMEKLRDQYLEAKEMYEGAENLYELLDI